ncbi:MAG: redoxin family protein [Candidatus Heimdallarchaeota archaeon]
MKMKKVSFILLVLVILSSMLFETTKLYGVSNSPETGEELTPDLIDAGDVTIDWTMEEIISDTMKTFSDFDGKVILIDFFAMWCGPCKTAMPYLRNINDNFASESDFVMMSIDVDLSEQESALESFAVTYNMNWFIFRDTALINNYYEISAIPTLMIINQHGYVYYVEEGFGGEELITGIINELLEMDDKTAPVLTNFESDVDPISILDSAFTASVDITDDAIRFAEYELTLGDYTETQKFWAPDTGTHSSTFILDPIVIWNETQEGTTSATIELVVEDFTGNQTTDSLLIAVTNIADAAPPVITFDSIVEISGTYGQTFDINVTITDDTMILGATLEIWTHGKLNVSQEMIKDGDTYNAKFYSLKVGPVEELVIKIIADDVSGKNTTLVINYTVTSGAGYALPSIIALFVLGGLIAVPLQRLTKRK